MFNNTINKLSEIKSIISSNISKQSSKFKLLVGGILLSTSAIASDNILNNTYEVQSGDYLYKIAKKFGKDVEEIINLNKGRKWGNHDIIEGDNNTIFLGSKLIINNCKEKDIDGYKIPDINSKYIYHKVTNEDTLISLSNKYNLSINDIYRLNEDRNRKKGGKIIDGTIIYDDTYLKVGYKEETPKKSEKVIVKKEIKETPKKSEKVIVEKKSKETPKKSEKVIVEKKSKEIPKKSEKIDKYSKKIVVSKNNRLERYNKNLSKNIDIYGNNTIKWSQSIKNKASINNEYASKLTSRINIIKEELLSKDTIKEKKEYLLSKISFLNKYIDYKKSSNLSIAKLTDHLFTLERIDISRQYYNSLSKEEIKSKYIDNKFNGNTKIAIISISKGLRLKSIQAVAETLNIKIKKDIGDKITSLAEISIANNDNLKAKHCTDWVNKIYLKVTGKRVYDSFTLFNGTKKISEGTTIGARKYASKENISIIKPGDHILLDLPSANGKYGVGKTHSVLALSSPINGIIAVGSYPNTNGEMPRVETYNLYLKKDSNNLVGKVLRIQRAKI